MQNLGTANRKMPNTGSWQDRHDAAWNMQTPDCHVRKIERNAPFLVEQAITSMAKGWALYAETHALRFGDKISEDYILGAEWLKAGKAIRALLNGETGRLDCGTVDGFILAAVETAGFTEEDL